MLLTTFNIYNIYTAVWKRAVLCGICACRSSAAACLSVLKYYAVCMINTVNPVLSGLNGNLSSAGNVHSPEDPNGPAAAKIVSPSAFCYRQVSQRY